MNLQLNFVRNSSTIILYSCCTSGTPKGICLPDLNFNACALQAGDAIQHELYAGCTMLSCMPCFHGFGLGINLHAVLIHGACCILMPSFNGKSYAVPKELVFRSELPKTLVGKVAYRLLEEEAAKELEGTNV